MGHHQFRKDRKTHVQNIDDEDDLSGESKTTQTYDRLYYGEEYGEFPELCIGIGTWTPEKSDEDSLSYSNFRVLNFLETGSAISVLEDLLQELVILKYIIGAPIVSSWDFKYRTLEERFSGSETPKKIFPEVDSTPILTTTLKLQRDRKFIENIIHEALNTLLDDGTFEPIYEAGQTFSQMRLDEDRLILDVKKNVEIMKDLTIRVERKNKLEDIEEKQRDALLYKLQDDLEDVILKCSINEQFVDKWEQTRDKQNKLRFKNIEEYYVKEISEFNVKSKLEKRVNGEMEQYIKRNQLELEEQLEEWMTRYDTEMEKRENKILQLKYMRDQTEEEVKRLQYLYETRQTEMKEWIQFREIRKRRTAASLMIQSWWRGFMVRKKLGPFKEKKSKAPKTPKKK